MDFFKETITYEDNLLEDDNSQQNDNNFQVTQKYNALIDRLQNYQFNHRPSPYQLLIDLKELESLTYKPELFSSLYNQIFPPTTKKKIYNCFISIFNRDNNTAELTNHLLKVFIDLSFEDIEFSKTFIEYQDKSNIKVSLNKLEKILTTINKNQPYFKNFYRFIGNLAADFASSFSNSFFSSLCRQISNTSTENQICCSFALINFFRNFNSIQIHDVQSIFSIYKSDKPKSKSVLYNLAWCAYYLFLKTSDFGDFLIDTPLLGLMAQNISNNDPCYSSIILSLFSLLLVRNKPEDISILFENINIDEIIPFIGIPGDMRLTCLNFLSNYLINGSEFIQKFIEVNGNLMIFQIFDECIFQEKIYLAMILSICILGSSDEQLSYFSIPELIYLIPEMLEIEDNDAQTITLMASIQLISKNINILEFCDLDEDILKNLMENNELHYLANQLHELLFTSRPN